MDWTGRGVAGKCFAGLLPTAVERPFGLSAESVASNAPPRLSVKQLQCQEIACVVTHCS